MEWDSNHFLVTEESNNFFYFETRAIHMEAYMLIENELFLEWSPGERHTQWEQDAL